jgi:hypothetical protein
MGEARKAQKTVVRKPEGKRHFLRPGLLKWIIKMNFKQRG